MRKIDFYCCLIAMCLAAQVMAQSGIEGYVFESNNRGYLRSVQVSLYKIPSNTPITTIETAKDGRFLFENLSAGTYSVLAQCAAFFDREDTLMLSEGKTYLKMQMTRKPGYSMQVTISESGKKKRPLPGAMIEVYNRSLTQATLVVPYDSLGSFTCLVERGMHYTVLLRKPGFADKRQEWYVDMKGCGLCVDDKQLVPPDKPGKAPSTFRLKNVSYRLYMSPDAGMTADLSRQSLARIIELEEGRAVQNTPLQPRVLTEANTSHPLPPIKTSPQTDEKAPGVSANGIRITDLPENFRGYAIEILRSASEAPELSLPSNSKKTVYIRLESDGMYTYLLATFNSRKAAASFLQRKIKPFNAKARLVLFDESGKQYIEN